MKVALVLCFPMSSAKASLILHTKIKVGIMIHATEEMGELQKVEIIARFGERCGPGAISRVKCSPCSLVGVVFRLFFRRLNK
jgi:hypothetical protein